MENTACCGCTIDAETEYRRRISVVCTVVEWEKSEFRATIVKNLGIDVSMVLKKQVILKVVTNEKGEAVGDVLTIIC